jgi:hypothetical protein
MAERATDPRDREGWLRLAQDWIELAEQGGGRLAKKALARRGCSKVGKNLLAHRALPARPT